MTRRELLQASGLLFTQPLTRIISLRAGLELPAKTLRLAVIADLHHGLAPDALSRLQAFAAAVKSKSRIDAVLQMGDFCYSQPDSKPCLELWKTIPHPKLHVLGNHDMDKCDKQTAMRTFGMPARYGSTVIGGYRIVVLDLNNCKRNGKLEPYANGNYYGASCNWADPEQLAWLDREIRTSAEPIVLLSHQPLGFAEPGQGIPTEQLEVLQVIERAEQNGAAPKVAVSIFGHLHVDRLEHFNGLPCYCLNSASYFWFNGMQAYTEPLYAFLELRPDATLRVEGRRGEFVHPPPPKSDSVLGRSASLSDRTIALKPTLALR